MITGAILGLGFFIIPFWAYRKGLQDGMNIKNDRPIQEIRSPSKVIKQMKRDHTNTKKEQQVINEFEEMVRYVGSDEN